MDFKKIILVSLALIPALFASAQDCSLRIGIAPIEQGEKVPERINTQIEPILTRAISKFGIVADPFYSQFFVAGRFDHTLDDIVSGPPTRYAIKTTFTIYIGDAVNQQVYATTSLELQGIGNSEERAYISALNTLTSKNGELSNFIEGAKSKIIEFYNKNYKSYLAKARTAMKLRDYEQALLYTSSIPECSAGYGEASELTSQIFQSNVDYDAEMLLAQARAVWAANPTIEGASEACSYLAMIDPSAKCYPAAKALGEQIGRTVKDDIDFWTKGVYKDNVNIEKMRISAARDIGVAWAKNQPKIVTNFVLRNRRYRVY